MSPLKPTSSGRLYTIDHIPFTRNVVPTTPLDVSHPFCTLWQSFLASLTNTGCDSFWNAMMRIYTGQPDFSHIEREKFKLTFLKNPPNVVISDMQSRELYGYHKRLPHLWSFIHISQCYVDLWVGAMTRESERDCCVRL